MLLKAVQRLSNGQNRSQLHVGNRKQGLNLQHRGQPTTVDARFDLVVATKVVEKACYQGHNLQMLKAMPKEINEL